jgi:pseudouridine-5'-phosphate glycosidase
VLVAVPVPVDSELAAARMAAVIDRALAAAKARGIEGSAVTPFLLNEIAQETGGASLKANISLLENNAAVAARIAVALKSQSLELESSEGRSNG